MTMMKILCFLASLVSAQIGPYSALAVLEPTLGQVVNAGDFLDIKWKPSPAIPSVDIILKGGGHADLATVATVAHNLPNKGSYTWRVPTSLGTSTALSLMIHDSRDSSIANFSSYFTILEVGRGITKTVTTDTTAHRKPSQTIFVNVIEHHHATGPTISGCASELLDSIPTAVSVTASSGKTSSSSTAMENSGRQTKHKANKALKYSRLQSNSASALTPLGTILSFIATLLVL